MATIDEELAKLQKQRDHGRLTAQEFETQKAALLASHPAPSGPNFPDFPDFAPNGGGAATADTTWGPPPRSNGNKTLFIILGVVGGVVLLIIILALTFGSRSPGYRNGYYGGTQYYSQPYYRTRTYYGPSYDYRRRSTTRRTSGHR